MYELKRQVNGWLAINKQGQVQHYLREGKIEKRDPMDEVSRLVIFESWGVFCIDLPFRKVSYRERFQAEVKIGKEIQSVEPIYICALFHIKDVAVSPSSTAGSHLSAGTRLVLIPREGASLEVQVYPSLPTPVILNPMESPCS